MVHASAKYALVFVIAVLAPAPIVATEWGSFKGRIVVDGTPPKLPPLVVTKDQFCIEKNPTNDSVIVGKDNALVNAVVYLRVPKGGKMVAVHPEYTAKLKVPVVLEMRNCMFRPHVFSVRVGQTLDFKNRDPVGHNPNAPSVASSSLITSGDTSLKVTRSELAPMPVVCNIHPWMKGYVLSLDHPYVAVTGNDGKFEIKNIPVGEHEFQFWHETGYLKNIAMKNKRTDNRGRVKLRIESKETLELGDLKVSAASLDVR